MSTKQSLLLFGRDIQLLYTRELVLQQAGFMVRAITTLAEVETQLTTNPLCRLLIICHTATTEDRLNLVALLGKTTLKTYQLETLTLPADLVAAAVSAMGVLKFVETHCEQTG